MPIMNEKDKSKEKIIKHLRGIVGKINTNTNGLVKTNIIPHKGEILKRYKIKKECENMENIARYNNMTSGKRSALALRLLKKGFSENKMSENDPIIKDILERTKTYAK